MKVIDISKRYPSLRFVTKVCPVLDEKKVYDAVVMVLQDVKTQRMIEITSYSNFLLSYKSKILNAEKNTRLGYAKFIVMFLNYIHFDRENITVQYNDKETKQSNLDKIENLTIEDGNVFLSAYKNGKVGHKGIKTRQSIEKVEAKLSNFYYYLYKNFKMKYLKSSHFKFKITKVRQNGKNIERKSLESLFLVRYPDNVGGRTRVEYISFHALSELISLATEHYPMIALLIAIQAFAGLRKGEACNVTYYNTSSTYIGSDLMEWSVDLRTKPELRSDGVDVGEIKSHAIAKVHPVFIWYFELILNEHERYINEVVRMRNKFGAMFLNRNHDALTEDSYERYFNRLVDMLRDKLSNSGIPTAESEAKRISAFGLTTHSLRFFFSNYIAGLRDTSIFDIAMYRRDKRLSSALTYIRNNPYLIDERIKKFQDKRAKKWDKGIGE